MWNNGDVVGWIRIGKDRAQAVDGYGMERTVHGRKGLLPW